MRCHYENKFKLIYTLVGGALTVQVRRPQPDPEYYRLRPRCYIETAIFNKYNKCIHS